MNARDMGSTLKTCSRCGSPLATQVPGQLCPSCMAGALFAMTPLDPGLISNSNEIPRIGEYELGDELGRGGMGVVYRAHRAGLNRAAAVKLILSGPLASPLERQRFLAEAEAAAALEHPGIVAIYEAGETDGQAWFAMQLVEGESLAARLRRTRRPLPPREATEMMLRITQAVHHAHERGFLHRDLKPANILLDTEGNPHVTDFGLARRLDSEAHLTLTGAAVGTPSYMAPEQTDTRQPPTTAVDVYSLGAILYELLSGHPPFTADSLPELFTAIWEKEPASISGAHPTVDRDLDVICRKCLEKDPMRRYRSAQTLGEDLNHWLNGEPIAARPVGNAERFWRWCRRRPALASLAAACVLLLLGGITGIAWQWQRAVDHAAREAEARSVAETKSRESRHALYAADMNLAQAALRANNLGRARRLLDAHRPAPGEEDLRGWEWRYLWAQCRTGAAAVMTPAEKEVRGVVCSGDGTIAVSNEIRGTLKDHEVPGRRIRQTRRSDYDNGPLAPHPDGRHFLVPTRTDFCEIWNFDFSQVDLLPLTAGLAEAAFSPDGKLVAVQGWSGQVRLFDFKSRAILKDLDLPKLNTGQGGAVAFVPGEPLRLAVGTGDSIRLYRCTDWCEDRSWPAHTRNEISALAVSPDGRRLASGACFSDPVIRVWDTASGEIVAELKAHTSWISSLVFSRDGAQLFAASADQTISVWHTEKWTHTGTLRGHTDEIWSMNPSGDGLISGGKNGEIFVWPGSSAPEATGRYRFRDETRHVLDAGDSADVIDVRGTYFLRRTPGTWAREPDCPVPGEVAHASSAGLLTYRTPGGRTGILDATARPPKVLAELDLPPVENFCADDGSRWLAFTHAERAITLFDIATRKERTLTAPGEILALGAEEARGQLAVRTPETVVLCDPATGRWQPMISPAPSGGDLRYDPAFRWVAHMDGEHVTLSRTTPFEILADFKQESGACSLTFSNDGRWLGIANEAAWARLWRLPVKGPLPDPLILRGHLNAIFCMAFTPDGSRVVTLCKDNEAAKFWDPETGMELLTLTGNDSFLNTSRFTRNGETLLASRDGHGWQAWHAPSLEAIAKAEANERW